MAEVKINKPITRRLHENQFVTNSVLISTGQA